ncbi:MAG: HpcH/HpaI aldolase/citrate lyase family protein [Clostridiales bacterium]|nr:HpcH/HpaI aldolase/citrate lyase family protein [Clostridiales bacterium]
MIINEELKLKYGIGPLLYTPGTNSKIAQDIIKGKIGNNFSLALCCEDTIADYMIEAAEQQIIKTLATLQEQLGNHDFFMPYIFIRVRNAKQMYRIYQKTEAYSDVLTGFVLPKYSTETSSEYNLCIEEINKRSVKKIYCMPILESKDIADYKTRKAALCYLKEKIDSIRDYVLNVRVGGNDFCNHFSVRRHCDETIYDILPVALLMSDILTFFLNEYVISAPVWEFFFGENNEWEAGLRRELKLDRLNGFIGKTVIHPKQIGIVNEALKVSIKDYIDARTIISWNDSELLVGKSSNGERMNEVKTHTRWAKKVMILAEIYGVI